MLDTALKTKWVEALRSGKYEQGTKVLFSKRTRAYCCLGVLCVVNGVDPENIEDRITTDLTPWFDPGLTQEQASRLGDIMNDAQGKSFAEIADYIEANL